MRFSVKMFVFYKFHEYLSKCIILKLTYNVKLNIKITYLIYGIKRLFINIKNVFMFVKFIKYEFEFFRKYTEIKYYNIKYKRLIYINELKI